MKGRIYGHEGTDLRYVGQHICFAANVYSISFAKMWRIIMVNQKNELVVKDNRLVEASYHLTLVEQNIILCAITEARRTQKGLNSEDFVTITAKDYANLFGADEKSVYAQLKTAIDTLFSRHVVIRDTPSEGGRDRVTKIRWISAASYIDGNGTIQLQFAGVIVPYITRLEAQFTRYRLGQVSNMTSAHAIRMYELLIQWGSIGKREIGIEWLKETLMIDGRYSSMKDFKKRVVDLSMNQINAHSDLNVEYIQRKTGRNVTHLTFTFDYKPGAKPPPTVELPTRTKPTITPQPTAKLDVIPEFKTRREKDLYIIEHSRPGETWGEVVRRLGLKYP